MNSANNINSFAENVADMVKASEEILDMANAINQSMTSTDSVITMSNGVQMPTYNTVINRVNRVENTMAQFTKGNGNIQTADGTYRKINVTTVSRPPENISGLSEITTFGINPNWFFESLQYPRCTVKIDLTDKIEASSDRVYVNRVILDSTDSVDGYSSMLAFYTEKILGQSLSYDSLISFLTDNNVRYREDKDEVSLPLTYEKYSGDFTITSHRIIKDAEGISRIWYYFDTLNYSSVDESGLETDNSHILSIGQFLRCDDSLFKIIDIDQEQKRVRLEGSVGFQTLGDYDVLHLYNEPFSEKAINVGIGINEINIIYVKAVDENYNLLSKNWSTPVTFFTNELIYEQNGSVNFLTYYNENVADFGKQWIAQAKEKQISAYNGLTPNAPVLNLSDLRVVQINTQLNATLDAERYTNLTSEIASVKSNIAATRNTISKNKDLLIQISDSGERDNIQNIINSDTESLNSLTTQYGSLVEELNTLLNEAGAINYTPKYHVRGFFGIPSPKYVDETNKTGEQSVIAFEIMYRYLRTDETGVDLGTYTYTGDDNVLQTGVFSDWNMITSKILEKKYSEETDTYYWSNVSTLDGTEININQIDIPIRSGEKLEIKVRSVSEAGYPYSPCKSDWSNSVIVEFPDNLTSDNSVTTILNSVKNDMTAIVLQETMSSAGVYSHLADSNSSFKHEAKNVQYSEVSMDASGNTTVSIISLQDKVKSLSDMLAKIIDSSTF